MCVCACEHLLNWLFLNIQRPISRESDGLAERQSVHIEDCLAYFTSESSLFSLQAVLLAINTTLCILFFIFAAFPLQRRGFFYSIFIQTSFFLCIAHPAEDHIYKPLVYRVIDKLTSDSENSSCVARRAAKWVLRTAHWWLHGRCLHIVLIWKRCINTSLNPKFFINTNTFAENTDFENRLNEVNIWYIYPKLEILRRQDVCDQRAKFEKVTTFPCAVVQFVLNVFKLFHSGIRLTHRAGEKKTMDRKSYKHPDNLIALPDDSQLLRIGMMKKKKKHHIVTADFDDLQSSLIRFVHFIQVSV